MRSGRGSGPRGLRAAHTQDDHDEDALDENSESPAREIAREALFLTAHLVGPKNVARVEVGIQGWRDWLERRGAHYSAVRSSPAPELFAPLRADDPRPWEDRAALLTCEEVIEMVVDEARAAGSLTALANRWRVTTAVVYETLRGEGRLSNGVLAQMGLEAVTYYRIKDADGASGDDQHLRSTPPPPPQSREG